MDQIPQVSERRTELKRDLLAHDISRANRSDVARHTGISLSGVSRILSGKRRASVDRLQALAAYFGVTIDELHAYLSVLRKKVEKLRKSGKISAAA